MNVIKNKALFIKDFYWIKKVVEVLGYIQVNILTLLF